VYTAAAAEAARRWG